jgi:large subunit ribosomal protein L9
MRVIFLQNIRGTARIGDVKTVPDGYARNYLIPRKLAKAATIQSLNESETLKKKRELADSKEKTTAEEIVERLKEASVELVEDANSEGHLYGSVDGKKIVHAINDKYSIQLHKDQVRLPHPIKQVGEHQITLDLHNEIQAQINVVIIPRSQS